MHIFIIFFYHFYKLNIVIKTIFNFKYFSFLFVFADTFAIIYLRNIFFNELEILD